jgi:hypothetical protein
VHGGVVNVRPFIPKDDQELPDCYGMTVYYIDGRKEQFEVAAHWLQNGVIDFASFEDEWSWIPIQNVKRVAFDKRFSKVVSIRDRIKQKASK